MTKPFEPFASGAAHDPIDAGGGDMTHSHSHHVRRAPGPILDFFVPGRPIPKGRPRVALKSGRVYTPQTTRDWEAHVAGHALLARAKAGFTAPLAGKLRVALAFSGARANADADNLSKACLDGAQGVIYVNDSQVVRLEAEIVRGRQGVQFSVFPVYEEAP